MEKLKPFFTFYGGKWRAAPKYPKPLYKTIIEPFAGAAGYSVRNYTNDIILIDKDPIICELWRYLISASYSDIIKLPFIENDQNVRELNIPLGAKYLIGFWLNKGTTSPCKTRSAWMREGFRPKSFWSPTIRERIANQVELIKHWKIIEGEYTSVSEDSATWFIDPPYQEAGKFYRYGSKQIDFEKLGKWCQSRIGQTIVCENYGANWLDFKNFIEIKSTESSRGKSISKEAIWYNET